MINPPVNLYDYETLARERLTANAFGYYWGGADNEISMVENRAALDRVRLLPRVLVDVSQRNLTTTVLSQPIAAPVIIAPMAIMKMAHRDAEIAVARAAGEKNLPMTVSTLGSTPLEEIADAATSPLWFQLYVYRDRAVTRHLVERAEAAGYQALMLTVDAPVAGNRERDVRNRFKLPKGIQLANVTEYALETVADQTDDSAIAAYALSQLDPALTWADVDWLASITRLPIIIKGILRADDARRAVDHGAVGIVVSNHGGRQLDTTPAPIDVLPAITREIGIEAEVLMDGAIRRGTDILKAIALGAKAVMVGRPVLWGLAVDGQAGAANVLDILLTEFDRALALTGCTQISDITPDLIFR